MSEYYKMEVTKRSYSSSANLGPGYDILSMGHRAFFDSVTVKQNRDGKVKIISDSTPEYPEKNTAGLSVMKIMEDKEIKCGVELEIKKGVPIGLGLGSSGASSSAAVKAVNDLLKLDMGKDEMVYYSMYGEIAACGSAHPDNVSSGIYGGLTLISSSSPVKVRKISVNYNFKLLLIIPEANIKSKTQFARSYHFIRDFMGKWGIQADISNPGTENIIKDIRKDTRIVFIESMTNPILRVNDIRAISEKCTEVGAILVVDSTVPTPYNLKSVKLGADIVVHSGSKFISGHNNVISGLIAGRKDLIEKIDAMRRTLGTSLDPNSAFLTENGMKTLGIRMEKINSNAMKIARILEDNTRISKVIYPGLPDHPDHEVAGEYMKGYSGIVCFKVKTDPEKFTAKLKKIVPANTMGGTETIISIPVTMSHRSLNAHELGILGVDSSYMRLSVGIEDPEEIIRDITNALNQ